MATRTFPRSIVPSPEATSVFAAPYTGVNDSVCPVAPGAGFTEPAGCDDPPRHTTVTLALSMQAVRMRIGEPASVAHPSGETSAQPPAADSTARDVRCDAVRLLHALVCRRAADLARAGDPLTAAAHVADAHLYAASAPDRLPRLLADVERDVADLTGATMLDATATLDGLIAAAIASLPPGLAEHYARRADMLPERLDDSPARLYRDLLAALRGLRESRDAALVTA